MSTIGEELRHERTRKGLSIKDVEQVTHIRSNYLEALEADNYTAIPGDVYVKGFIRNYANFLNLDGARYMERYNILIGNNVAIQVRTPLPATAKRTEEVRPQLTKEEQFFSYESRLRRRKKRKTRERLFGAVFLVVVVVFLVWLYVL